jgi:hypothetical protein
LTVNRARKIERFLSQPFHVAEQFTGTPGVYVPIAESIRGFKEILEGKYDDLPERAFFLKGTIDDVVRDAGGEEEKVKKDDDSEGQDEAKSDSSGPEGESQDDSEGQDESEGQGESDAGEDKE